MCSKTRNYLFIYFFSIVRSFRHKFIFPILHRSIDIFHSYLHINNNNSSRTSSTFPSYANQWLLKDPLDSPSFSRDFQIKNKKDVVYMIRERKKERERDSKLAEMDPVEVRRKRRWQAGETSSRSSRMTSWIWLPELVRYDERLLGNFRHLGFPVSRCRSQRLRVTCIEKRALGSV